MIALMILLSVVASIFFVVGVNLVILGKESEGKRFYYLVTLGFACQGISFAVDVLSLLFGPQALKASMNALPIALNIPLVYIIFRFTHRREEPWPHDKRQILVLVVLCAGVAVGASSFFMGAAPAPLTAAQVVARVTSLRGILYLLLVGGINLVLFVAAHCVPRMREQSWILALVAGVFSSSVSISAGTVWKLSGSGYDSVLTGHVIGGIFALTFQVLAVMGSLGRNIDSQGYITVYTTSSVVFGILAGGVVYLEFESFGVAQWVAFVIGNVTTLVMLVVWAVMRSRAIGYSKIAGMRL